MRLVLALLCSFQLQAETRTLSLKEVVQLALRDNPDLLLARIDEQKANLAIRVAKDPFRPKVILGSGLAYSNGFPMSIEGSAPSVVQARAISSIFNRATSFRIAQSIEESRTAVIDSQIKRDEVVLRTATLFLDASRWISTADAIRSQVANLESTSDLVALRVKEGRELEIEADRADLALLKTQHRLDLIAQESDFAEASLSTVLGLSANDRVKPVRIDNQLFEIPKNEEDAIAEALQNSKDLRRLDSAILAKRHEIRQFKSNHLPSVDLVAQYGLFARFNNYEDFFNRFQRHNGQIGVSIQIPLFPSAASIAQGAQAEGEINALRTQVSQVRNRLILNVQNGYRQARLASTSREIARRDLELSRKQVGIILAQMDEGRATLRQLEESRFQEQEKWILYFESQFTSGKARLELLRLTGTLLAALQ